MSVEAILCGGIFTSISFFMLHLYFSKKIKKDKLAVAHAAQIALLAESKKVAVIVDNLQQALFAVGPGGTVVEPITKFTEKIFGRNISGENLMTTLYKSLENKKEVFDSVAGALVTVMGENELQWDLVESNFPRKVDYLFSETNGETDKIKLLKINISPIWDNDENLDRLLFVVEDITNFEKLEMQFKQEQEQSGMVECILENSLDDLNVAIKHLRHSLDESKSIVKHIDPASFMELLRLLHTMKGNARQLKMRVLSDQIHNSESIIMEQMSNIIHSDDTEPIAIELEKIEKVLNGHSALIQKFLQSDLGEGTIPISSLAVDQAEAILANSREFIDPEIFQQLQMAIVRLGFKSIAEITIKFGSMITDISNQLGKKVELEIENDALANPQQAMALQECLMHLIRNSIDHGIEAPSLRIEKGKSDTGKIKIYCIDNLDSFTVVMSDDGDGIDGDKVAALAISKGLVTRDQVAEFSPQQKINLIFLPNFSTKNETNNVSGRGLGMDVVKERVEKMGGNLTLQTEKGKGLVVTIKIFHAIAGPIIYQEVG